MSNPAVFDGILNVAIPVTDHDRAIGFYTDMLGFEVRFEATFGPGLRWVEVAPAGAQTVLALAPAQGGAGVDTGVRLTTTDAAAAHERLRSLGVAVDDILTMPGVPPMFVFRDLDGNRLYAVEESPGQR